MNTEVWVYTVQNHQNITLWQCVFDYEISNARVLKEYREETGNKDAVLMRSTKRTFFRESRDPVAVVPEVQPGIVCSLEHDMHNINWFNDQLVQLSLNQPILSKYLQKCKTNHGEVAALVGVIVYKLIESQIEADQC